MNTHHNVVLGITIETTLTKFIKKNHDSQPRVIEALMKDKISDPPQKAKEITKKIKGSPIYLNRRWESIINLYMQGTPSRKARKTVKYSISLLGLVIPSIILMYFWLKIKNLWLKIWWLTSFGSCNLLLEIEQGSPECWPESTTLGWKDPECCTISSC